MMAPLLISTTTLPRQLPIEEMPVAMAQQSPPLPTGDSHDVPTEKPLPEEPTMTPVTVTDQVLHLAVYNITLAVQQELATLAQENEVSTLSLNCMKAVKFAVKHRLI